MISHGDAVVIGHMDHWTCRYVMKHGHGQLLVTLTSSHYNNYSRVCQDQDDLLSFLSYSSVDPPEGNSVLVVLVHIVWVVMVLVTIVVIIVIVV